MFAFVSRQELDTLQIVSVRFNVIVEQKMTLVCLRQLRSATISRSSEEKQFMLVVHEVSAKEKNHFLTGVDDETAATMLLFNACRSSSLDCLKLSGTTPLSAQLFDSLKLVAPSIVLKKFCIGSRVLPNNFGHDKVLHTLQAFGGLRTTIIGTSGNYTNLLDCLIRTCFKAGSALMLQGHVLDKEFDTTIFEDALLEFCFGACDERYATRERSLYLKFHKSLQSDFLQRWIEVSN